MPEPRPPSALGLWLEEALTGWILPVLGLAALAAAASLYMAGLLPEGPTAAALAGLVGLAGAAMVLRPAVTGRADRAGRILSALAAAGTLVLAAVPAIAAVTPGAPLAEGELRARGDTLPLPPGLPGRARLLVRAVLPAAGAPALSFVIGGPTPPAQGHLERTFSYARVGRGGRAAVAHDHSAAYLEARLAGVPALVLERREGEAVGPLHVAIYRDWLPTPAHVALALAALALAAAAEARLRRGNAAALAGMALAFGLLVAENGTPASALGTAFGAVLLGGLSGAAVGGVAGAVAKRLVPPAPEALRGARAR